MDDFMIRLATDAAEAEGSSGVPKKEEKGHATKEEEPQGSATTSEEQQQLPKGNEQPGITTDQPQQQGSGGAQSFGSSMFGFAASWGKRLQNELHLDQLVDQVKRQSEEVTKAYRDDITEFAQAVRVGAVRGMDELSTRFEQMKTELGAEFQRNGEESNAGGNASERQVASDNTGSEGPGGILQGLGKHFQMDALKQQQERAKRLMGKLGTELEDLLRDAIVIEAPGSAGTEEQKSAARKIIYDRRMAQLAAIQESEDTYLVDPATKEGNDGSDFATFAKEFGLDDTRKEDADLLLKENPAMAALHTQLVPEKVTDSVFWTRYFFHAWMIDQEEIRRKKLVEAAVAATEEDQFSWDLDEEEDADKEKAKVKKAEKEKEKSAETPETSQPKDSDNGSSKAAVQEGTEKTEQEAPKEKPAKTPSQKEASKAEKDGGSGNDDDAWGEWE
ncbi:BSD domain-containing protein 1 [Coemansia sp. RSA 1200]|nr:BSD domain-containing protein 1 [Coemansia sp. RSA 1200]